MFITNTVHERTEGAVLLLHTGSISESARLMCLRTLKPIVRIQWTVFPIPQVLVIFINKLVSLGKKNSPICQDPVFTRGVPDVEEEEPFAMLEDMEGAYRTTTRVQPIPENV